MIISDFAKCYNTGIVKCCKFFIIADAFVVKTDFKLLCSIHRKKGFVRSHVVIGTNAHFKMENLSFLQSTADFCIISGPTI